MQYNYLTLDVFSDQRFGGNPLAVVFVPDGLPDDLMQTIAREFCYSETVFISSCDETHDASLRIFTPFQELPFAGHPTIGAAFALATQSHADRICLKLPAGSVDCAIAYDNGTIKQVRINAPKALELCNGANADAIADCLGLDPSDIVTQHHAPQVASVGLPFVIAQLTNSALAKIQRNDAALHSYLPEAHADVHAIYAYCVLSREGDHHELQARLTSMHGAEDPATGSAAGALCALYCNLSKGKVSKVTIKQGEFVGRPSTIHARFDATTKNVSIAGQAVLVCEGQITV